jgi:hypothetical protein
MDGKDSLKTVAALMLAAWLTTGCVMAGSNQPHADGPGATTPTEGPTLCRDGTAPPCNDR